MPRKQTLTKQPIIETAVRKGIRWSSSEIDRLHNEYELQGLSVYEIAYRHSRGVHAILHRLADEGLIASSWQDARGWEASVATEKKAPAKTVYAVRTRSQEQETVQPQTQTKPTQRQTKAKAKAKPSSVNLNLKIDETRDYTCYSDDSDSVTSEESDEEYTLEDAQNDYDPYSMSDKVEFFREILSYCKC